MEKLVQVVSKQCQEFSPKGTPTQEKVEEVKESTDVFNLTHTQLELFNYIVPSIIEVYTLVLFGKTMVYDFVCLQVTVLTSNIVSVLNKDSADPVTVRLNKRGLG